ncbi:RES family NAD+ phosphorylase [Rhizobium sp. WYCCWR 11279]|uniref:RES family NAD+ phosphorylase n=1 Tax=Rhizobium changzhiense TaxID=2692317 RepID=UPI001492E08A|nr:RES family NAD+ phosphorylase [Rhizobium changzhiense]NNU49271.1 RES family NAD+ phosphorylase [Rhizobium changzhiense]
MRWLLQPHANGKRSLGEPPSSAKPAVAFSNDQHPDDQGRYGVSSKPSVATLYAATSREAAAFESIFHDIEPAAAFKTVRLAVVEARTVSVVAPKRDLRLASLFAPDLKAWKLTRTDLIETPKSTYGETVLWAEAIHRARADVDGLIWTSRQCDPEQCIILFEDRMAEDRLDVVQSIDVGADADLLLELRDYGRRAGITIIS